MTWTVEIAPTFTKDFAALPEQVQRAVDQRLDQFGENPYALDFKKLQGTVDRWRLRVGDYRVIVRLDGPNNTIVLLRVRHRREAYR